MDLDIGVVAVDLARQQRLDLAALGLRQHGLEARQPLLLRVGIGFVLAELDEGDGILQRVIQARQRAQPVLEIGALAHQLLGRLGIVPEFRVLDLGVQLGQTARGSIDVKDASSAVPRTA